MKTFNIGDVIQYVGFYGPDLRELREAIIVCPAIDDDEYLLDNGLTLMAQTTVDSYFARKYNIFSGMMVKDDGTGTDGCEPGYKRFLIDRVKYRKQLIG